MFTGVHSNSLAAAAAGEQWVFQFLPDASNFAGYLG